MNNLKKLIIKFIVLVILISSSLLFMTGKVNAAATRNYNFNATNILDNLSKDPKFGLIIPVISADRTTARKTGVVTANKVRSDFQAKGLTVKTISTGNVIGTGTVITVNENSNKYTMLIYGDINGDGKITVTDISIMIDNLLGENKLDVNSLKFKAADLKCRNLTTWNRLLPELSILISFNLGEDGITKAVFGTPVLYNPDTTKPVITLKNTSVTIKVGDNFDSSSYIQSATDDTDGNIISKVVKSGTVNTNTPGNYTVKYDVTDNAGNKADTKTLTVTVKDYMTSIAVDATNAKKTFDLNEAFSTTGLKVTVNYRSGATKQITSGFTTSGFSSTTAGQKTITVSYTEEGITKTDTYTVDVVNNVTDIRLEGLASVKNKYKLNDTELDTSNLVVKLVYADSSEQVTENYTISGFDTSTVGEKTITVTYNNQFSKTFNINVYDPNVVVAINVETIGENELRMESPISKAITFKNEFDESVSVIKSDITITASNTVNVVKNKNANSQADDVEAVTHLRLIPQSEGDYEITVTVGSVSETITGSVVAKEKITSVTANPVKEGNEVYIYLTARNQYNEEMSISSSDIGVTSTSQDRIRLRSGLKMGGSIFVIELVNNGTAFTKARISLSPAFVQNPQFQPTDAEKVIYIDCKDADDIYQENTVLLSELI